jgi:UDP-N-acetylmuramate--alanine ligase
MEFDRIERVYLLGIGGIGMSAIARFFLQHGVVVSGYDKTATSLTEMLAEEGAAIHFQENERLLDPEADLVIYTPAIPADNIELNWYQANSKEVRKRSEVLEWITQGKQTAAVAGSHGKTTISAMIAHLMQAAHLDPTAFLGGISLNLNSNYLHGAGDWMVVEADEFDRSLLRLDPTIGVITAADEDHHDVYSDQSDLENTFVQFAQKVKPEGLILVNQNLSFLNDLPPHKTYALDNSSAWCYVTDLEADEGGYYFDLHVGDTLIEGARLNIGGRHNVENAMVAAAVALEAGADEVQILEGLASFKGIFRRFQYVIEADDLVMIDDYAHHPAEIRALIRSVRELYPGRKITIIFQPHLYSRTEALAAEFAKALDEADEVILLDIYPAREDPIPGVSSDLIFDRIELTDKFLTTKEDLIETLSMTTPEVLLTAGAGDIDQLVEPIKNLYA